MWLKTDTRLRRGRKFLAFAGLVPLAGGLGCGSGFIELLCLVPFDFYIIGFDAAFGIVLGLTIRIALERRKFERGAATGAG